MRPPSLTALGEQYGLDDRQLDQLDAVLDGLAEDEHAPTTVRDPEQAVDVHLADSLVALELDRRRDRPARIADIGAGAGFPGLPLAVALPASEVRLVESQRRSASFCERAIAAAGSTTRAWSSARVEEWSEGSGRTRRR